MSVHMGFITGALALTALEALVKTNGAGGNVAGAAKLGAAVLNRIVNPSVPAIPNLAGYHAGQSSSGSAVESSDTGRGSAVPAIVTPNAPAVTNPVLHA